MLTKKLSKEIWKRETNAAGASIKNCLDKINGELQAVLEKSTAQRWVHCELACDFANPFPQ